MIEQVLPNIYRIEIELPKNPLKSLNSYFIKGQDRNLIIDTGMNRRECLDSLKNALRELDVDLEKTDLFLTHMHADHSGLVSYFRNDKTRIICSKVDGDIINSMCLEHFWVGMRKYIVLHGFPGDELTQAIDHHPGHKYCNKQRIKFDAVKENSLIAIGDYRFICIETPGHTQGHLCLYESNHKVLISGDHVLQDISPNITLWSDEGNPLQEYLQSLNKASRLDVELVLPGHRRIFTEYQDRIRELIAHHQKRAAETLMVLRQGPQNVFQIASQMSWDIKINSWEEFPPQQKLFACGEILAHLKYLMEEGQVVKERQGEEILFRRD